MPDKPAATENSCHGRTYEKLSEPASIHRCIRRTLPRGRLGAGTKIRSEHPPHPLRRHGLRGSGMLRAEIHPHTPYRQHGPPGDAFHAGLCGKSGERTVPRLADDGTACRTRACPRQPGVLARLPGDRVRPKPRLRRSGAGALRPRTRHTARDHEEERICDGHVREVGRRLRRLLLHAGQTGHRRILRVRLPVSGAPLLSQLPEPLQRLERRHDHGADHPGGQHPASHVRGGL